MIFGDSVTSCYAIFGYFGLEIDTHTNPVNMKEQQKYHGEIEESVCKYTHYP